MVRRSEAPDQSRIIRLLRETEMTYEDIGRRLHCSGATVSLIDRRFEIRKQKK